MEVLSHVTGIIASLAALSAPPAAMAIGLVPRLGPLRAIALALSTRFKPAAEVSQRATELLRLKSMLETVQRDQYVVVAGPKGIGKSCLVDTALQLKFGVVSVHVAPGTREEKILADTFKAVARSNGRFLDHSGSAKRVLWWHSVLFREPATVVLQASERGPTEAFAALHAAARTLTFKYGARVLIDASNNSLPEAAVATKRERVLYLDPVQRDKLEEFPMLLPLHNALKEAEMADVVWMCVGGNPADYINLLAFWEENKSNDIEKVSALFVLNLISTAQENVNAAVISNKELQQLFDLFRKSNEVPSAVLKDMMLVRLSPDKVLRLVRRSTSVFDQGSMRGTLIPADAATALVLSAGLKDTPSLMELKALAAAYVK